MNKSKIYLYILYGIVAVCLLMLASCASDDIVANSGEQKGQRMSLGVDVVQINNGTRSKTLAPAIKTYQVKTPTNKPIFVQMSSEAYVDKHTTKPVDTRGVSVTSDTFYDRFGLLYYEYDKADTWSGIVAANTQSPTKVTVEKSAGWHTNKYWPGIDHKLTFMAYAPYEDDYKNASGTKYIQLPSTIHGYPTLTYTVPDKVEEQQDLLVSAEPSTQDMEGDYNKVIGMKFYHTLSAINFKIGSTMAPGLISKIEVKGIHNKGTYDFGTKAWSNVSGTANYAINPNYNIGTQRGVVFTGVDDSKNDLFLVMPQTVPSGAKIVVTIEGQEMELPINGHEWLPGYTITYTLSTSQEEGDYIFSVSKINDVSTEQATTVTYKVSSYMQSYYGTQTPVGWKAKYAIDSQIANEEYADECGDVVTGGFLSEMLSPTATTTSVTASIASLEPPVSDAVRNSHTATLRTRESLGTKENPYDLSTLGGTRSMSTANCYVVGAPGWYKFPLVYGNCIKNGANNTAVYGTASSKANYLNHLNKQISNPYLRNNSGVVPSEGVLVWQDAYKMIEPDSVFMTSDQNYICFKVNKDNICQGNALISARNSSKTILWSWHIWVTDENFSSATNIPVTNLRGSVYDFMKVPLGYCEPDRRAYKERKYSFLFEQEESKLTANAMFSQSSTAILEYGVNAPYYQFGRTDPVAISRGSNASKTLYYASGYAMSVQTSVTSRGGAIQNPTIIYRATGGEWNTSPRLLDVWDAACTAEGLYDKSTHKAIKTIYDPNPVGYKLAETEAFTGFTTDGKTQTNAAYFNVYGSFDKGYHFYTKPGKKGTTIYIRALGAYVEDGGFNYVNTIGIYWLAEPSAITSLHCGLDLNIRQNLVYPYIQGQRWAALNILPVVDE